MYTPPVNALLTIGDTDSLLFASRDWLDYPTKYGLTTADVPELIRLLLDKNYDMAVSDEADVWGKAHACRALGQLQAQEALPALIEALRQADYEDDWLFEDAPQALTLIGPTAIPYCAAFLETTDLPHSIGLGAAADALGQIGQKYPEERDNCVGVLMEALSRHATHNEYLNALLIQNLTHLKAVEAFDLLVKVFASDNIAYELVGDWDDVRIKLGLLQNRTEARFSQQETDSHANEDRQKLHEIAKKKKAKSAKKKKRRK